jgi:hypothetical protein
MSRPRRIPNESFLCTTDGIRKDQTRHAKFFPK